VKPENLNPKAREAFARSVLDVANAIFKSIILLFTVVPIAAILKVALQGGETESMLRIIASFPPGMFLLLFILIGIAFGVGFMFRREAIMHLHELEDIQ
jgi:hypothetical protein